MKQGRTAGAKEGKREKQKSNRGGCFCKNTLPEPLSKNSYLASADSRVDASTMTLVKLE